MMTILQLATSTPSPTRSARYGFISTQETLAPFTEQGYTITQAMTVRTRRVNLARSPYAKHLIRMRPASVRSPLQGEVLPEVILINSHDGTSSFKLLAGLFRLVCSNGLIVATSTFGSITIPHTRLKATEAVEAAGLMARQAELVATRDIPAMMARSMTAYEAINFAESLGTDLNPAELVRPNRMADTALNLWTVFNTIQEHLTKGGIRRGTGVPLTATGRLPRRSSAIRSIDRTLAMNTNLWAAAQTYLNGR